MTQRSRTRIQILITLLLSATGMTLGFAVLLLATMLFPFVAPLEQSNASPQALAPLAARVVEIHQSFWPVVTTSLLAVWTASLLLYRRAAGPFQRFERLFRALAEGRMPQPVHIRNTDFLYAETEAFNDMLRVLRDRLDRARSGCRTAERELEALRLAVREAADPDEAIEEIRTCLKRVDSDLAWLAEE